MLSQLNRGIESRDTKEPRLSDLRMSGSLEQDADVVLLLHRDLRETPHEMKIIVGKNRQGMTGDAVLDFAGHYSEIRDNLGGFLIMTRHEYYGHLDRIIRRGYIIGHGGHTGHGLTTDEYLELEKRRRESMKQAKEYMRRRYGQKQIVKVEKHSDWGDGKGPWAWYCRKRHYQNQVQGKPFVYICDYTGYHDTWIEAYSAANHHARLHESRQL